MALDLFENNRGARFSDDLHELAYKADWATKGHLYEVDLPDSEIAKMLDWDKPLKEMPTDVQDKLLKIRKELGTSFHDGEGAYREVVNEMRMRGKVNPEEAASAFFVERGIPGSKFFDQMSRDKVKLQLKYKGKPYGEPFEIRGSNYDDVVKEYKAKGYGVEVDEGTRNFVVFDPKKAKIVGRK